LRAFFYLEVDGLGVPLDFLDPLNNLIFEDLLTIFQLRKLLGRRPICTSIGLEV